MAGDYHIRGQCDKKPISPRVAKVHRLWRWTTRSPLLCGVAKAHTDRGKDDNHIRGNDDKNSTLTTSVASGWTQTHRARGRQDLHTPWLLNAR